MKKKRVYPPLTPKQLKANLKLLKSLKKKITQNDNHGKKLA